MQVNNADFSFAGIKTALRRAIEAEAPGPPTDANLQASDAAMLRPHRRWLRVSVPNAKVCIAALPAKGCVLVRSPSC